MSIVKKITIGSIYFIFSFSLFYYYTHVEIEPCHTVSKGNDFYLYECNINSNVSKSILLGIGVDDILDKLTVNSQEYDLSSIKERSNDSILNDYKQGYPFNIKLNKGQNLIEVLGKNTGGPNGINIKHSASSVEYILGFFIFLLPLIYFLHKVFFLIVDANYKSSSLIKFLPIIIILVGIGLRIYVVNNVPNAQYQHDYDGHLKAIEYYAKHPLTPPQPDKALQYPQQPLYYILAGIISNTADFFSINQHDKIYIIRLFSSLLSGLGLLLAWKLVQLYTKDIRLISIFLAFLSLTPSFVLMGAFVNNDSLNALLGIIVIYAVSLYYNKVSTSTFLFSTGSIVLALLTKASSIIFTIYFSSVLLFHYKGATLLVINRLKKEALIFSVIILFIFGWILFKAYIPMSGEFRFVNSALFSNQIIPYIDLSYLFTFHYFELIEKAQATVLYDDAIRFSLPTYFYGTMFLDDHIYVDKYLKGGIFKLSAQLIYLLGFIYIIGLFSYIVFFKKLEAKSKLLVIPVIINLLLIVKFLNDYWVVCNSHFRYFSPVFSAIGLIYVIGLQELFKRYNTFANTISIIAIPFYISQIYWLIKLVKLT